MPKVKKALARERATLPPRSSPAQAEIAKGLFESATEEQKDVFKLMGVEQPTQPTPDLTELCRQHIDALPESIKTLLGKAIGARKGPNCH